MTDATAGGFTVDLWKAVAVEAGLDYTLRVRPFHQLLQEFKEGKIDVLINLAMSDERHRFADFTVPHVTVHGAIFVRKGQSSIQSENDLATKSIIVLNADLAHDYAVSKGLAKQLVLVDTAADGLRLLASGRHDAMLLSKLAGLQTMQGLALSNITALPVIAGFSQKFAFAMQHGRPDLLARLNEGLAITKANGVYNALYERWFGVYEKKEIGLRDVLVYVIPVVILFRLWAGYLFYRRQAERNLAALAIEESRDLLTAVIDTAPVRVFWKDREMRYLGCNTAFAHDAGMKNPEEMIGKDDFQMGWSAQAELYRSADQAVMVSGVAQLFYEEPQTTPDGKTIWLRTSKVALKNHDGEIVGVLGVYEDITSVESENDLVKAFEAGVDDYLTKPVNMRALSARLKAAWRYVRLRDAWERDHQRLTAAASELALTNRRLQHAALTDPLTELANRRAGLGALSQAWSVSVRHGTPLCVISIDIDHFKSINDTYGHAGGDLVLQRLSQSLRAVVRQEDTVCRWGGEEFMVICPNLALSEGIQMAQRLRKTIASTPTNIEGKPTQITVSLGISEWRMALQNYEQLLTEADQALYAAKRAGRNCLAVFAHGTAHVASSKHAASAE